MAISINYIINYKQIYFLILKTFTSFRIAQIKTTKSMNHFGLFVQFKLIC